MATEPNVYENRVQGYEEDVLESSFVKEEYNIQEVIQNDEIKWFADSQQVINNPMKQEYPTKAEELNKSTSLDALALDIPPRTDAGTFDCPLCTAVFTETPNFHRHMQWSHTFEPKIEESEMGSVIQPNKCDICGEDFIDVQSRILHIKEVHFGIKPHLSEIIILDDEDSCAAEPSRSCISDGMEKNLLQQPKNQQILCPQCGKQYMWTSELQFHEQVTVLCPYCGEMDSLQLHDTAAIVCPIDKKIPKSRMIECKICLEHVNIRCFKRHLKTHNIHSPGHFCYECGLKGNTASAITQHRQHHKNNHRLPIECPYCGGKVVNENGLKLHIKLTHKNDHKSSN